MNISSVRSALAKSESIVETAEQLGKVFASSAEQSDDTDSFVAENFKLLRSSGLVEAAVPRELGGGGATIDDLAQMLRTMARYCGSTALAFSMHTHQVAIPAWRWRHQALTLVEPLLKRVAEERIILLSSGGSDWIGGSGAAERVEGGYKITARKIFTSAAPAGDLLMTGAVFKEDSSSPPMVLHFAIPMNSSHVKVMNNWKTLGMRATGSHDVVIDGHVVPESAVVLKRKAGEWHLVFQIIATIAFPLVYSVYLGVAEAARDIALALASKRRSDHHATELVGKMQTALLGATLAHQAMLATVRRNSFGADSVNEVMMARNLLARHAIETVEYAMEAAGGAGFYRAQGLERRFRDIQGARYHPLQQGPQALYAGSMALGLPVDKIF
jgi:alkylation response protein AidB-like acyl-CoA dehydrogenase